MRRASCWPSSRFAVGAMVAGHGRASLENRVPPTAGESLRHFASDTRTSRQLAGRSRSARPQRPSAEPEPVALSGRTPCHFLITNSSASRSSSVNRTTDCLGLDHRLVVHAGASNSQSTPTRSFSRHAALDESLIKEINHRVKGAEQFWNRLIATEGEAILQTVASLLRDGEPLTKHILNCPYCRRSTANLAAT